MVYKSDDLLKSGLGLLAAGATIIGTYVFVRSNVRESKSNNSSDSIFGESSDSFPAAQYASRLRLAFENCGYFGICIGTNEQMIIEVVDEIPSKKAWNMVEKEYTKQTKGGSLGNDLYDELKEDSDIYNSLIIKINSKPEK